MSAERQVCDNGMCVQPAVTWVPETSKFMCELHAPLGAEIRR